MNDLLLGIIIGVVLTTVSMVVQAAFELGIVS